jgi:Membrane bound O-acyl transferase family
VEVLVAMVAVLAYGAVFGLAMRGSPARRLLLIIVAAFALVIPFFAGAAPTVVRTILAGGLLITFLRLIDLARDTRDVTPARRVMHAMLMVELRRTARIPKALSGRAVGHLLMMLAISTVAFLGAWHFSRPDRGARVARGLLGIVFAYASFDALCSLVTVLWSGLGFDVPRLHDHPFKSRSVAEFWSERWNRIVGSWLRVHCFMPLARRRLGNLGVVAAFTVSTAIHIYLAWTVLDARAALLWAGFFALQIPIVFVERALGVASWPATAGRAWTITVLVAASPLFVEPMLRAILP